MDSELVEDLEEALEGVDPVEFLLADPLLHGVAEDLWNLNDSEYGYDGHLQDLTIGAGDSQQHSHEGFNSSGATTSTSCSGSASPSSDYSGSDGCTSTTTLKNKTSPKKKYHSQSNGGASCTACQRPARGYRYYGVVVCNSCRAFFSRSIKDMTYMEYLCVNEGTDNNCFNNSKSCGGCQKCRFNRCLKVGMEPPDGISPDYVCDVVGEDENVNPEQEKVTVIEWGDRGIGKDIMRRTMRMLEPAATLTEEEKGAMTELTARQVRQGYVSMSNLIRSNIDIFKASMDYYYKGKHFPLNLNKTAEDYMSYSAARNYYDSQEYPLCKLNSKDISRLVEGNFPLLAEYVHAYSMNKKVGLEEEVKMYVKTVLDDINGDVEFRQKITSIYKEASGNGKMQPLPSTYHRLYNKKELGLIDDKAMADKHFKAAHKLANSGVHDDELDPIQCILTICVMMYSPDFNELDNPAEVERIQMSYAYLLQRYLKCKDESRGDQLFIESMMASSYARELREIRNRALKKRIT